MIAMNSIEMTDSKDLLKNIANISNSEFEKQSAYYIIKAKIFEYVAKSSLQQQNYLSNSFIDQKQKIVKKYESKIKSLNTQIQQKQDIVRLNDQDATNKHELTRTKLELEKWKAEAIKLRHIK